MSDNNKKLLESRQELALNNKKIISLKNDIPFSSLNCDFNWEEWKNNRELQKFCADNKFWSIIKLLN